MRGHVDAESLALYAEGQLSRGRTARVRAHLSGCPECATTAAALTDVTAQLSQVPAAPMPAPVAARLDAALSAEAAQRAAGAAPAPAPAPRPPRRNPLFAPPALRILAAAGATLVVAGGVGYAVSQFSGSSSSGTSGTGRSAAAAPSVRHHVIQGAPDISPGGSIEKPNTTPPARPVYARTSTDYQSGRLVAQARQQLAEYTVSGLAGPDRIPAANVPAPVQHCVRQLAHGRPALFVDLARYQQRPAIVVVLSEPGQAIVASYSCTPLHSVRLPVTSAPTTR